MTTPEASMAALCIATSICKFEGAAVVGKALPQLLLPQSWLLRRIGKDGEEAPRDDWEHTMTLFVWSGDDAEATLCGYTGAESIALKQPFPGTQPLQIPY
jgi:hypothetical protein